MGTGGASGGGGQIQAKKLFLLAGPKHRKMAVYRSHAIIFDTKTFISGQDSFY